MKTRQDQLQIDYLSKLNDEEKEWLNRFHEQEINAKYKNSGKLLDPSDKSRKQSYKRNNARNFDIYTKAKASNKLMFFSEAREDIGTSNELEKMIYRLQEKLNDEG